MNIYKKIIFHFRQRMQEIEEEEYNRSTIKREPIPVRIKPNAWTDREINEFRDHLAQVIAWTAMLSENFDFVTGEFGHVFRQTNPMFDGQLLYHFTGDYATWTTEMYAQENYEKLLRMAIQAMGTIGNADLQNIADLGRIISFETCITTNDGAPIAESKHFVDESDVPPIDTWFFLKQNYFHGFGKCNQVLFCWIPKQFEKLMQQAMDVEILDSYCWMDENDPEVYERITSP